MKKILSIFIAAVMVISLIPVTVSAAVDYTTISGANETLDAIVDKNNAAIMNCSSVNPSLTFAKGTHETIKFWGWFGLSSQNITTFGYSINGAAIVYDTGFIVHSMTEEGVSTSTYSSAYRHNIAVPISALGEGTHSIVAYAKLADGTEVKLAKLTLTLTAALADGETVPTLYTGDLSVLDFDFQDSVFTNGYDLTTTGGSGNTFKSKWTLVDGLSQKYSKVVVSGTNKYAHLQGFMEVTPDYRWQGGYEFSVDLKGYDSEHGTGVFINQADSTGNSTIADTTFPLYERYLPDGDGNNYLGNTGLFLTFTSATKAKLAIHTYDASNANTASACAIVAAELTVPSMDSFQTLKVVDDGEGTITLSMAGSVIATVKYADDGIYAGSIFSERYYKTVKIYDASNALVAETTKGLLSYYKWVGFGTRTSTLCFDNIAFSEYTAPAKTLSVSIPTDIVAEPGATVTVPVLLSGDAEILLANGTLKYDTALTYKSYTYAGSIFSTFDAASSIDTSTAGEVSFIIMNSTLEDVVADGILVKFNFTVPADAADGTVYTFEYIPSDLNDAFVNYNEDDFYPVSVSAGAVTVEAPEVITPTEIEFTAESEYYLYNSSDVIVAVPTGTGAMKYSTFVANLATDATYYKVFSTSGTEITSTTANITTDCTLKLYDSAGNVVRTYGVAVLGDVDANGRANLADYGKIKKSVTARTTAKDYVGVYLAAADITLYTRNQTTYKVNLADYGDVKSFITLRGVWNKA